MLYYNDLLQIFFSDTLAPGVVCGFASKAAGNGTNIDQTLNFFNKQKINFTHAVFLNQIHSANVQVIHEPLERISVFSETDGAITNLLNTVLIVRTADCLPIAYADPESGFVGISHNGWRGTIKRISLKIIDLLKNRGVQIKNLKVIIGPGINQCCYEISEDRYYAFLEEFNGYAKKIFYLYKRKIHLNLLKLNYLLLLEAGLIPSQIDYFPFCTACDEERFFSFRRQSPASKGEMFNYIFRKS